MASDEVLRSLVRDDAYRVERVLAKGPSGTTELVTLDGEGPLVRKRIPAALANATAWATVMGLSEPLLPQVEELYRMPDELVVVCAYVPGDSLRERMDTQGPLDAAQAVIVMHDLCHAAGVLHEHGIVHRDITPGNVILAPDGAHLIDLGIARHDAKGAKRDTHVLGTWGFAAPEQFGFAQTDARSDVYALGRLLGYMLTGIAPNEPAYVEVLADERMVGPALAAVVARATAFEPSARYQSAADLAAALDGTVAGSSVGAGRTSAPLSASSPSASSGQVMSSSAGTDASPGDGPSTGPRRVKDASPIVRAAADLCWLACAGWLIVVLATGTSEALDGFPNWKPEQFVMAAVTVAGAGGIAYEAYAAITHRGHYASGEVKLGSVLRRMGQVLLYVLFAVLLEIIVLATFS